MTASEKLCRAAALIRAALGELNMRETKCGECGHRHFENRVHAKIREQLAPTPERLEDAAERLIINAAVKKGDGIA